MHYLELFKSTEDTSCRAVSRFINFINPVILVFEMMESGTV